MPRQVGRRARAATRGAASSSSLDLGSDESGGGFVQLVQSGNEEFCMNAETAGRVRQPLHRSAQGVRAADRAKREFQSQDNRAAPGSGRAR